MIRIATINLTNEEQLGQMKKRATLKRVECGKFTTRFAAFPLHSIPTAFLQIVAVLFLQGVQANHEREELLPYLEPNKSGCGVLCTYAICEIYDLDIDIDDVAEGLKWSEEEGVRMSEIQQFFSTLGLPFSSGERSIPSLCKEEFPAVALLEEQSYQSKEGGLPHFVVLLGVNGSDVFLLNYPSRPMVIPLSTLEQHINSVILTRSLPLLSVRSRVICLLVGLIVSVGAVYKHSSSRSTSTPR